jgi:predicted deacylase
VTWLLGLVVLWLAAAVVGSFFLPRDLASSRYPSPEEAEAESAALAASHPERCRAEEIGRSREGRPLVALRIAAGPGRRADRPRLLVTAQIHAVEFVGGYVARTLARRLVEEYGRDDEVTRLLERAEVVVVPLANPDGARRVWRRRGRSGLGAARFTQGGVDPNRNFPAVPASGRGAWNTGRDRPGSPWYRGPHALSEPECRALAELARRERFCGSIHFHSFGCVVYLPELPATDRDAARRALDVFDGPFQLRQPFRPYRPVRERSAAIVGQLDPFLLHGLGTPSVTVEVGRPGRHLLDPRRALNLFWIANPPDPDHWASNDAGAAIHALSLLLDRSGGRPLTPDRPELADF